MWCLEVEQHRGGPPEQDCLDRVRWRPAGRPGGAEDESGDGDRRDGN